MSREVMNAPKGMLVDHRNHDTLDNQKSNLRIATGSQNQWNRGKTRYNTSGYKGVHFLKASGKFTAHLRFKKRKIHLGCFDTAEEAYAVYQAEARRFYGEFAGH
jgi:HNH endonuclease